MKALFIIFLIIGIISFVIAIFIMYKKRKFNNETDPDSGLSDSWRLSDDREHHSAHSHHGTHDSGGDSSSGDGGGGGD